MDEWLQPGPATRTAWDKSLSDPENAWLLGCPRKFVSECMRASAMSRPLNSERDDSCLRSIRLSTPVRVTMLERERRGRIASLGGRPRGPAETPLHEPQRETLRSSFSSPAIPAAVVERLLAVGPALGNTSSAVHERNCLPPRAIDGSCRRRGGRFRAGHPAASGRERREASRRRKSSGARRTSFRATGRGRHGTRLPARVEAAGPA